MLPDLDLGVFVLASPTVTFSGVTGSTGSYTVTVTLSGRVTIGFVDGARPVGGSAALTGTYTVAGEALDAGDLALTLDDLVLTLGDVVTVRAATASLAQDGGDLVVTASAVTAALTVPNGPALQLTATSLDLLVQADRDVAFRVAGGTLSLTGVPGVSATGTGWSLVHNGTGADVTLGGTTVLGTVDVQAGGAASLVAAGQTLTATTLTVQRSGRTLTLAATGLGLALAAGSTSVLTVSAGTGNLVVDDTGISGTLTGTATTAPTFTLLTLDRRAGLARRQHPPRRRPRPARRSVRAGGRHRRHPRPRLARVPRRVGVLRAPDRHGRRRGGRARADGRHGLGGCEPAADRRRGPARGAGRRRRRRRLRAGRHGRRVRLHRLGGRAPAGQHHPGRGRADGGARRPVARGLVQCRRGRGEPGWRLRPLAHRRGARRRRRGERQGRLHLHDGRRPHGLRRPRPHPVRRGRARVARRRQPEPAGPWAARHRCHRRAGARRCRHRRRPLRPRPHGIRHRAARRRRRHLARRHALGAPQPARPAVLGVGARGRWRPGRHRLRQR